jgi:hypothetical protein
MSSARFEPSVPAFERPQSYALDRVVTGIGVRQISHTFSAEYDLYCTKLQTGSVCAEFSANLLQSALNNCKYTDGQT